MRQLQNESLQEINNQVPFTLPKQGFEKTLVFLSLENQVARFPELQGRLVIRPYFWLFIRPLLFRGVRSGCL